MNGLEKNKVIVRLSSILSKQLAIVIKLRYDTDRIRNDTFVLFFITLVTPLILEQLNLTLKGILL